MKGEWEDKMPYSKESAVCKAKTVWIDLDNSPHVPFFAPIVEELEKRGFSVVLTARDCFQVKELLNLMGLKYKLIGHHYGKNRLAKLLGLCIRSLQMLPAILRARPSLAISHGSRSQLMLSKLLGIRSIMIVDYEFARVSAGIHPDWMIVPQLVPMDSVSQPKARVLTYPGIKEDVYAPSFKPQVGLRRQLGVRDDELMVTVRPPATEAHYHVPESDELFAEVMTYLAEMPDLRIVVLPRNAKQEAIIVHAYPEMFESGKAVLPNCAVDGMNLVWYSDLIISGGGTMNREAAALGVPVYSIFRGRIGAVDRFLSLAGLLTLIEKRTEVRSKLRLIRRNRPEEPPAGNRAALQTIMEHLTSIAAHV